LTFPRSQLPVSLKFAALAVTSSPSQYDTNAVSKISTISFANAKLKAGTGKENIEPKNARNQVPI